LYFSVAACKHRCRTGGLAGWLRLWQRGPAICYALHDNLIVSLSPSLSLSVSLSTHPIGYGDLLVEVDEHDDAPTPWPEAACVSANLCQEIQVDGSRSAHARPEHCDHPQDACMDFVTSLKLSLCRRQSLTVHPHSRQSWHSLTRPPPFPPSLSLSLTHSLTHSLSHPPTHQLK